MMLTGKMVRVTMTKDRVVPRYLDTDSGSWLEMAEQLIELFRSQEGRTHGEIDADIEEALGDDPSQLIHQGLVKLLEDRCEFEVVSGHPPEELRSATSAPLPAGGPPLATPIPKRLFEDSSGKT